MPSNTTNYNLVKPAENEYYDINIQNGNMDIIDVALTPAADSAQVPTGNGPGKLVQWVSWLANRIKAITGKANWWETPVKNIQEIWDAHTTHMAESVTDVVGVHGLTVESGTFTPVLIGLITAGANTYEIQKGNYYRVGKLCHFDVRIKLSLKAGMGGAVAISGLPFVCAVDPNRLSACSISHISYLDMVPGKIISANLPSGNNKIFLFQSDDSAPLDAVYETQFGNTSEINISGVYQIQEV